MGTPSNDKQRKEFEEFYRSLSPEERRDRVLLEPAFRYLYNEITAVNRVVQVPHYFWSKWVPILGPLASTVYMKLRQYCYYNPDTGEKRNLCWPKQATLAQDIGVKKRETLAKGVKILEEHGFIETQQTYYKDPQSGRPRRGTLKYRVFFEIPLVPEDASELLIRSTTGGKAIRLNNFPYKSEKRTYRASTGENSSYMSEKRTYGADRKPDNQSSTGTITNNVNVLKKNTSKDDDNDRAEYLAQHLAHELADKKSLGFYRRVTRSLPESLVHITLSETKDAHHRGLIKTTLARYFTDSIKRKATERGIELTSSRKRAT